MDLDQREERYRNQLLKHFAGRPVEEILFFVNRRRFAILDDAIGAILRDPNARVLNLACGPFALELYLEGREAHVHAIDIDPVLPSLHETLAREGLIARSSFEIGDVGCFTPEGQYDLIIINDLLYDRAIDFETVFDRYRPFVKPGGVLYFDILDERAGALWRAFGRDARYRRYDMDAVRGTLATAGFTVEAETPSLGIRGGMDRVLRTALWRGFRVANNIIFKVRRNVLALMISGLCALMGAELIVEGDRFRQLMKPLVTISA